MCAAHGSLIAILALTVAVQFPPGLQTNDKEVKPKEIWTGSIEDEKRLKDMPNLITDTRALEKLWKEWKVTEEVPKIDFAKEIVLIRIAGPKGEGRFVGQVKVTLDDKGNLQTSMQATTEVLPGFRYWIARVSREGVKTVDGKVLPKN